MAVDLDEVGGNLLRGCIALILWIIVSAVIQMLVAPLISHNWAAVVGYGLGFIIVFIGFSYWYYRQQRTV
jgi:uncharacterized membrane protein YGL010W